MAGTTGLEPAASAVTGQRSNQLNYVPNLFFEIVSKSLVDRGFGGGWRGIITWSRHATQSVYPQVKKRSFHGAARYRRHFPSLALSPTIE